MSQPATAEQPRPKRPATEFAIGERVEVLNCDPLLEGRVVSFSTHRHGQRRYLLEDDAGNLIVNVPQCQLARVGAAS